MIRNYFGTVNGQPVYRYTISGGMLEADVLTFGGIVWALRVPDRTGRVTDISLGLPAAADYETDESCLGALVGRVCNRIGGGQFVLHGKTYHLDRNDGENTLHSGAAGFHKRHWSVLDASDDSLTLGLSSPDGDGGFPGTLSVRVTYTATADSALRIAYEATADADTPVSLTSHIYFNLSGADSGHILDTRLSIFADSITPVDRALIPHGGFLPVAGTPLDFRTAKPIGRDIGADDEQLRFSDGYDVNYVLRGSGFRHAATAVSDKTGIAMDVLTDRDGVQFYSGNALPERRGKTGTFGRRCGFCLETQSFPNAVNCKAYPDVILPAGAVYRSVTLYRFRTEDVRSAKNDPLSAL